MIVLVAVPTLYQVVRMRLCISDVIVDCQAVPAMPIEHSVSSLRQSIRVRVTDLSSCIGMR